MRGTLPKAISLRAVGGAALRRTLRYGAKAAIAAALVAAGVIGLPNQAQAQIPLTSRVDGTVTPQPGDRYLYEFTVHNTTLSTSRAGIVDWELPLIVGPGQNWSDLVDSIMSPTMSDSDASDAMLGGAVSDVTPAWYYEVINPATGYIYETSDPAYSAGDDSNYYDNASGPYGEYDWSWTKEADPVWQADNGVYGPNPDRWLTPSHLIHWYTPDDPDSSPRDPIWSFDSRDGFSFMSDFAAVNAPYMASWENEPSTIGDPPTPQGGALPGTPQFTGPIVPLPAAFPVAAIAMAGMAGVRYLRRRALR